VTVENNKALWEMEVGPPKSPGRGRLQTAASRCGKEPWLVNVAGKGMYTCQVQVKEAKIMNRQLEIEKGNEGIESESLNSLVSRSGGSLFPALMVPGLETARIWLRLPQGTWEPVAQSR
jgi:hypothetical protein